MTNTAPMQAQGFNEGKGKPFTADDIRFTTKGNVLYAITLGKPLGPEVLIKSLAANTNTQVGKVELLGNPNRLNFTQTDDGLHVTLPNQLTQQPAYVFKLSLT